MSDAKEARAEAKAAAARAKALRPWYKKKRFVIPIGLIALAIIGTAVGSDGNKGANTNAPGVGQSTSLSPSAEKSPEAPKGIGDGTYTMGKDIQTGTYRSSGSDTCYWARLKGFSGELKDIIANGNNSPEIVTVAASDAGFDTRGCGRWLAVEETGPSGGPASSFGDGTYKVSFHIAPGRYRADGTETCYWARLSDFSHAGVSGIKANGNNATTVEVAATDAGFTAFGCGKWTKV